MTISMCTKQVTFLVNDIGGPVVDVLFILPSTMSPGVLYPQFSWDLLSEEGPATFSSNIDRVDIKVQKHSIQVEPKLWRSAQYSLYT